MTDDVTYDSADQLWIPLDLVWKLRPAWNEVRQPAAISMVLIGQYEFAAVSSALPIGDWWFRLRLGPTQGSMRLVTCDPDGHRREPRTELFPTGDGAAITAHVRVDFATMCMVIQKREPGPASTTILGVDFRAA